ncbi:MAG: ABC transporter ATP-binding protein, partial [Miltoncostaeaceae bacterium]
TTAIRILLDLIRPTAGRAEILGHDCQRDGPAARSAVGYLPGDVQLPSRLDGGFLLARAGAVRGRAADPARVAALTERLGADLGRRVGELSKGNRQAVAILLALAHRPRVLVMDEPTSGLDPIRQREVLTILREEAAGGVAVFFSSHILGEVEHACRRVAILRAGRLVALDEVAAIAGAARRR